MQALMRGPESSDDHDHTHDVTISGDDDDRRATQPNASRVVLLMPLLRLHLAAPTPALSKAEDAAAHLVRNTTPPPPP